jgi:hypothetical protein
MTIPYMVSVLPHLTTNGRIRRVRVSVPLIEVLLDSQKYFRPDEPLPLPADDEFRPIVQQTSPPRRPDWAAVCAARDGGELERLMMGE